jgi:hypothetical protein
MCGRQMVANLNGESLNAAFPQILSRRCPVEVYARLQHVCECSCL